MNDLRKRAKCIKLVATDLDGTLLDSRGRISEKSRKTAADLMKKGIYFTVCTGRSSSMMMPFIKALGLTSPLICHNGCEIIDPVTQKFILSRRLSSRESLPFLDKCWNWGLDHCVNTDTGVWMPEGSQLMPFHEAYVLRAEQEGFPPYPVHLIRDPAQYQTLQIKNIVLRKDDPKYGLAEQYVAGQPGMALVPSSPNIIDVLPADNTKASGLAFLADHLGIRLEECCVFGDFENDLEMFQAAGVSVAVENASTILKEKADFITESNDKDGVAKALEIMFADRRPADQRQKREEQR